jgi:hypothetical protein
VDFDFMRRQIGMAIVATRHEVLRNIDEAVRAGKLKEARSWKSALRKVDKQMVLNGVKEKPAG